MKTLFQISMVCLCFLLMPDHLLAAIDELPPRPPLATLSAAGFVSKTIQSAKPPSQKADVFISGDPRIAQRVKKKKSFFKNKAPLPAVELPSDWGSSFDASKENSKKVNSKKPGRKKRDTRDQKTVQPKRVSKEKNDTLSGVPGSLVAIPIPVLKNRSTEKDLHLKRQVLRSTDKVRLEDNKRGRTDDDTKKSGKGMVLPELKTEKDGVKKAALPVPPPVTVWPSADIIKAQNACKAILRNVDAKLKPIKPIRYGVCGTPAPLKVEAVNETDPNRVVINPPATLNCNFTARFDKWVKTKLQPLAMKHLKSPVRMVHNVSSYSCRHRYNDMSKKISEHALVNALDIAGFTLKDGTSVSVLKHWDDEEELGTFLKDVHASACKDFVVVLGPEANEAHKNHFHFDLGRYPVCE